MGHLTITFLTICHLFTSKSSLAARRPAGSLPVRRCGASAPLPPPLRPARSFPLFPLISPPPPARPKPAPRPPQVPALLAGCLQPRAAGGQPRGPASPGWVFLRGHPFRGVPPGWLSPYRASLRSQSPRGLSPEWVFPQVGSPQVGVPPRASPPEHPRPRGRIPGGWDPTPFGDRPPSPR